MEEEITEVEVFNSPDEYDVLLVGSILEENNIPYIRKDDGIGVSIGAFTYATKRIFVKKEDYEKALSLIPIKSSEKADKKLKVDEDTENIDVIDKKIKDENDVVRDEVVERKKLIYGVIIMIIALGLLAWLIFS
jgi:hypothetical protein